jgi:hypothetical protein
MAFEILPRRRFPGQSIRDEKERLIDNRLLPYVMVFSYSWLLFGWEAFKAWSHQPPEPTPMLCVAIVTTGIAAIGLLRLRKRFGKLNRGESGEMKVGETLEELRGRGYRPFHAIRRDKFDIDHVVLGPEGVFVIETKWRSGKGVINFRNGEGLFVNGLPDASERDPLAQARGNAAEVRKMIKEDCQLDVWTTALVVFVGDWKVKETWQTTDVRVVAESGLRRFFERQDQPVLKRDEIKLIATHLERHARA